MNTHPAIILVEPQMGENIGAAARAMLNFGLTDLRIVAPRDGWPNAAATDNGAGAFDVIEAEVFERFEDSIADLQSVYATTARRRDMVKPVFSPAEALGRMNGKTGFVFGRERSGLENHHIALCHGIIEIPANPDFSSLNLAQAVLVLAYEWQRSMIHPPHPTSTKAQAPKSAYPSPQRGEVRRGGYEPAPHGVTMELMARLEGELETSGFFRSEDSRPTMINNLRALLTRAQMSEQEARTFHGIISALLGSNKKAG